MSHKAAEQSRAQRHTAGITQRQRRRRQGGLIWILAGLVLAVLVAAMMLTSRPESSATIRSAPDFTLSDTAGVTHTLAQHQGENVLLYFSEGAGCQSCLVQMAEIEKSADKFADLNTTVLPIVMNTKDHGVKTPFLLDDGAVSAAYGTLGKGMHGGLPGHSFVLIDESGQQRWYGEYPSMWLSPSALLDEIRSRLNT
ncbi:MAG: peroxiredoxin family protein [Candidatus Nanopelagicales bacterium]|nr:peroxiredoxin family protein [Candidatus Nanopelagicales bacterium]